MTDIEGALGKLGISTHDNGREKTFKEVIIELQDKYKQLNSTHREVIRRMFFDD